MSTISDNLKRVWAQIDGVSLEYGRPSGSVGLLAVSKNFGVAAVQEAYAAGQRAFGENYVQEALDKIMVLRNLEVFSALQWHMIGPIQSNKTRAVAEHFDWVHSVDRYKIAQRLSQQRPAGLASLQMCLQVNIDGGANKSGCSPQEALALAQAVSQLPNIKLRGIMVIPEPAIDFVANCQVFERARSLFDQIKRELPQLDTLSMGMSADVRAAVKEGSTMVRVGTAIFGARS